MTNDRDKFLIAALVLSMGLDEAPPVMPGDQGVPRCKMCGHCSKAKTGECAQCGVYHCATCKKYHIGEPTDPCNGNGVDIPENP